MASCPPRIALEVWSSDFAQMVQTTRVAERLGFDALYYGESPTGLNLDCWTTLSALAAVTDQIRLGPVIANILPTYRSLISLAKQAATVAIASDGRLDFRTGVGAALRYGAPWWEPYGVTYPPYERRLEHLTTALSLLGPLWAGEQVALAGDTLVGLGLDCPPIPVTVAATGPKAITVACSHAQVWESSFRTPAEAKAEIDTVEGPNAPAYSLEIDGFIGASKQTADAVVEQVITDRGSRGEDLRPVFDRALLGTPDKVAEQIVLYHQAGVDQLVVVLHDPHNTDSLQALAEAKSLADSRLRNG